MWRRRGPRGRVGAVGGGGGGLDLGGRRGGLDLDREGVRREPYVEEERLWALMSACTACILLRAPTMGETSGSAVRTLSLGKPLVVSDLGWFAELPHEVAFKVPVGDGEVAALVAALERLAGAGGGARPGRAAPAHPRRGHEPGRLAGEERAALRPA